MRLTRLQDFATTGNTVLLLSGADAGLAAVIGSDTCIEQGQQLPPGVRRQGTVEFGVGSIEKILEQVQSLAETLPRGFAGALGTAAQLAGLLLLYACTVTAAWAVLGELHRSGC